MDKPALTESAISRARQLVDNNIAFGDVDDDTATITTGGMIGDVAELYERLDALPTGSLREALDGPPDTPEVISPLSWLHSMIQFCEQVPEEMKGDDPDAFNEMVREVTNMYTEARAALNPPPPSSRETELK